MPSLDKCELKMKCSASLKIEIKLILSDIKNNICSLFKKKQKIRETIKDGKITNYLTTVTLNIFMYIHPQIHLYNRCFLLLFKNRACIAWPLFQYNS